MSSSPPQPTPPPALIAHSPETPLASPQPTPPPAQITYSPRTHLPLPLPLPEEISPFQLPPAIPNAVQHEYNPACTCLLCMQTPQPSVPAFPPPIHHGAAPDPGLNIPQFELPTSVCPMPEREDAGSQSPGSSDKSTVLSMPLSPAPTITDPSSD